MAVETAGMERAKNSAPVLANAIELAAYIISKVAGKEVGNMVGESQLSPNMTRTLVVNRMRLAMLNKPVKGV